MSTTAGIGLAETTTYQAGVVQSTATRMLKKFTDDCLKAHGITSTQWFAIGTIYDAGKAGIGITELGRKLDTNTPYVTNLVNLLESKNIVIKEDASKDSRSKVVKISRGFQPKCQKIETDLRRKMRHGIYSRIEPAELEIYLKVIRNLSNLA